jgi:hypothetical protein
MDFDKIEDIGNIVVDLFTKYKDNSYMKNRLETHLFNLPNMLEQENKKYDERVSRINELSLEQENFFKVFLCKHPYYYMPYNNIYYEYDDKTYKIVKDDDIHHMLLSTITDEGKLIQWKHKTKQNIIKKIKERTLFKSVPETYTIQNVLAFLQTIFETKVEAKYFLTVIGDCILKKNTNNLLYFVSSNTKKLITFIDSIAYVTTGNSIMNNFITKYHETHKLEMYRLIKTNDPTNSNTFSYDIIKGILNHIGIDLLCVAAHYSERYTNADNYLSSKSDESLKNYVLYFVQKSLGKIVDDFIGQCIEKVTIDSTITWKNMHYIWKLYLTNMNIPNMVYSTQLQTLLLNKLENNKENNKESLNDNITFLQVTSKYLPYVSSFLSFWEKYMTIINETNNTNDTSETNETNETNDTNFDDEYEIDELITLYKNSDQRNSISDTNMIKMICHYFSPQVEIVDNKYITNVRCKLWSKQDDVKEYLLYYKTNNANDDVQLISLDELYEGYKSYFKSKGIVEQKMFLIVSKQFFEKFVSNQLTKYIQFDKFVSSDWLKE